MTYLSAGLVLSVRVAWPKAAATSEPRHLTGTLRRALVVSISANILLQQYHIITTMTEKPNSLVDIMAVVVKTLIG